MKEHIVVAKAQWIELTRLLGKMVEQEGMTPRTVELAGIINLVEAQQPK